MNPRSEVHTPGQPTGSSLALGQPAAHRLRAPHRAAAVLVGILTLASFTTTHAQAPAFPQDLATTSQSGQFVVTGPRVPGLSPPRDFQPGTGPRTLTPQTVAIACERVKADTLRVLALPDVWRTAGAHIHVAIDPRQRTNAPVAIEAVPFEATWKFRVQVPSTLSEERLTRAIVQAVVLDLSNRPGNQRAAEPPLWLIEGITQTVLECSVEGPLPTPETRTSMEVRRQGNLARVREQLSRSSPPSFYELSQPDLETMSDRDWRRFSAGAHLCLHDLQRLPEGLARIRQWLFQLQNHWNWQTGFIEAFHPHFRSLLDTEKWWAITVANFTGRDAGQAWPREFTLRKLDEALQPVGILPGAGSRARKMPLEEILGTWEFPRQLPVLRQLLQQLHAIRINAPPDLRPLVFRYIDLIDDYVDSRSRVGLTTFVRGQAPPSPKLLARDVIRRLRDVESERAQTLLEEEPAPTIPSGPPS